MWAVAGRWLSALRVVEGVVGRWLDLRAVAHQIGHDHPNAVLLVVEHDRGAAGGAGAQLQGTVGVLVVERLALHAVWIVHLHVAMLEEHDVARLLAGDALAHGAVAGVVVERLVVRVSMDMVRSEEHTSELQSLMRKSYAVFCLKKQ